MSFIFYNSDPVEDEALNTIDTGSDTNSEEAQKKFGYKILLKKINGKEVPVGKIKFTFPTIIEITPVKTPDETPITVAPGEEILPKVIEQNEEIPEEVEEEIIPEVLVEEEEERKLETTTELNLNDFLPEPITATIPEIEATEDENLIATGVMKISEDTQEAIKEIMDQTAVSK